MGSPGALSRRVTNGKLALALAVAALVFVSAQDAAADERAVVRIWGTGSCTAFLVRPTVFVTAKHCVQRAGAESALVSRLQVRFDQDDPTLKAYGPIDAAWVKTAPGAYTGDDDIDGHDFGIFQTVEPLEERLPGVRPLQVYSGDPQALVGEEVMLLGYGERRASYRLTRAATRIREVGRTIVVEPAVSCYGDSGGPLVRVSTGEVVGVASREWPVGAVPCDPEQRGERSIFQRIDVYASMIEAAEPTVAAEEEPAAGCSVGRRSSPVGGGSAWSAWPLLALGLVAARVGAALSSGVRARGRFSPRPRAGR